MYRDPKRYDDICKVIGEIYKDYGFNKFPLDEKEVCRRMGVSLVPYSSYGEKGIEILRKRSENGFFIKGTRENPPKIFYDDTRKYKGEIRFTIFHELKHYVYEDEDDSEDDLADFFARYFMCPIPYLI